MQLQIKRVYEVPSRTDGFRILVDRLWPRGLKKEDAAIDVWAKDLAPSNELRKWFGHDEDRFAEFARRYHVELETATGEIDNLIEAAGGRSTTLLYGARDQACNNAVALQEFLQRYIAMGRA